MEIRAKNQKLDQYFHLVATEDNSRLKVNLFKFLDSPRIYMHMGLGSKSSTCVSFIIHQCGINPLIL